MTTINKLTRTDSVTAGDVVPVYVQNQGDARGAAMSVIATYVLGTIDLSGTDFITQYALPAATGFSIQVNNTSENTHLIISPTGAFAAGTIVLPAFANLIEGQQVMVTITQPLAALTITPNGSSIIGAPIGLMANQTFILKFDAASSTWYMIGNSVQVPLSTGGPLGTPLSGILTNCTGLPISTGVSGLATNVSTFLGAPSSANLRSAITDETGTGALVFSDGSTLTGTTLTSVTIGGSSTGVLTGFTGLPISTGVAGLGAGIATFLATPSSANLASAVTGETGTGALVFSTSPALITPDIGTPSAGTLTNCLGLPITTGVSGLGANVAAFLANPNSANFQVAITGETGTGAVVFSTNPVLVTPNIGVATADSLQRGTVTTKTTNFSVASNETWITCNGGSTITVTMPSAASFNGREIYIKTIAAFSVVSASSNIIPKVGGAATTTILAAAAGSWATLVSDGTNWVTMAGA